MARVAIIGAGPAGLCSAKYLAENPNIQPTVFEKSTKIGGTWVFTDITAEDVRKTTSAESSTVHSSMYKNLRTNTPKELMAFIDHPYPEDWPSFIGHRQVLEYIEKFANQHDIHKYIKFGANVSEVRPVEPENRFTKWLVSTCVNETKETLTETYDSILICSGHHSVPMIPDIPGMSHFPGEVIHSHQYRDPIHFTGKKVIILGASYSGQDISLDLAKHGVEVTVSHRGERMEGTNGVHELIEERYEITKIDEDGAVVFKDGSKAFSDVLLLCTGYIYSYPFLTKDCKIEVIENHVTPLYKHVFNANYPTMGFIGVVWEVCNFPTFSLQAKSFEAVVAGRHILPSFNEMMNDVKEDTKDKRNQGIARRHYHRMADGQWSYYEDLYDIVGCNPFPDVMKKINDDYSNSRSNDLLNYRERNYKILNDNDFNLESAESQMTLVSL